MISPRRRVLVLGLDGGTFDLLDPWMRAGELPYLRSLVERGFRAPLRSVFPPKTIPAWYCFATGADPGELGVFGFTEPNGSPGTSRIVQTFRPHEAFWDHLSRRGVTVGVLNFPLRAAYPIHGFVVPGMLADSPPTYPPEVRAELERATGAVHLPELPAYREADRATWMAHAIRAVDQYARYAELLTERYRPSFLFALLRETDRVQHQHWAELTRPFSEVPEDLKEFWRAVDRAGARIERAFRAIGGPSITLVISDHGHGAARSDFFTNRWLAQEGYLTLREGRPGLRRRLTARLLVASDRIPGLRRIVRAGADRLRGGARREWLGRAIAGGGSFESMVDRIDWRRTVAYSYPVPEGIYLNPSNADLTPDRRARAVAEIRERLERFPGSRIEVFAPQDIYRGRNLERAPALLIRLDGLATESRMDFAYPDPLLRHRPGYFYGSGVHRMDGILIAEGDGVSAGRRDTPYSLLDVAPTVLDAMGFPAPETMSGRSFAPDFRSP